ncbi:MAG: hypothetical protein R3E42_14860 [Burkholderiaceae bacterium]
MELLEKLLRDSEIKARARNSVVQERSTATACWRPQVPYCCAIETAESSKS